MDRQTQFKEREQLIFQVAEQLLLENGDAGMTLDALAAELDLAKGTLYKHFQSKDELYMLLIIRNERMLLAMAKDQHKKFNEVVAFFMLHHLHHPERTVLFHSLEEKLSMTGVGIQRLFTELYQIRRQRLRMIIQMAEEYLTHIQSSMSVRDYLAGIWSLTQGAAMMLNSSFYQRYLGSRDGLRIAYIEQALSLPLRVKTP
ncbi:TetR/AcrR family transcriptional regulator [Acinetobacter sp. MD2]|uniref:TetR/AcrR family transcriptional regulator n=1 Tax=Acinetobacter sp. MD2 TaxID=2600066 RepID=UPI002D1F0230|nr:TetR/AcrR family transcriptional regulator [Acinetobacter sp. MD2]MEB3766649.1 TetR/AcrR family transcriptional regulator [Acinetobacter sp. MD2]